MPSGLYILTIGQQENATGMLASWVQQVSFEPPMVSLAIKSGRPVLERIGAGEPFVLNVLPDGDKQMLKHFGKGFEPGEPAFEGVEIAATSVGVPALAAALASLECRFASGIEAGDHHLIAAHVTGGELRTNGAPMIHVRRRGDHY